MGTPDPDAPPPLETAHGGPHGHDCGHDHDPAELDVPHGVPVDPGRARLWRVQVVLGSLVGLVAWIGAPTAHVLLVERPLRHIEGSPWTFALAGGALVAVWLLTATPEPRPARPHTVGAWFLRILAGLATFLTGAGWALGHGSLFAGLISWLSWPLAMLLLTLSFAYVGRLHRLFGQRRLASLADLAGVVLPLLWIASQLVSGYPGPPLWGPALVAMGVGTLSLSGLVTGSLRS